MILKLSRLIRSRVAGEDGIAMIMVMGTIMVLTVLLGVTLAYAISVQPQARHDQDWNAALASAQGGVDDYIAKLNQNNTYWTTVDCTNIALKGPNAGTNTCGWTSSTAVGWQNVVGGNPGAGTFHYDVDPSTLNSSGNIRVSSTGNVRGVKRTIQVLVNRGGSTNFLYYTDFEDADPGNQVAYPSGAPNNACGAAGPSSALYWWDNGSGARTSSSGCREITFAASDVLNGKAHFNDTPLTATGATFQQGFETSDPDCALTPYNISNCVRSTGTPVLGTGLKATNAPTLYLPDNSDQFATYPGCVFTGDTRIRFKSDGTMDVWNTTSLGTTIVGPASPGGTNCGVAANYKPAGSGAYPLAPAAKQNVPVPSGMVIYVKNAATTSTCTPGQIVNGTSSGSTANDMIPTGDGVAAGVTNNTDISYFDPDSVATTSTKVFKRVSGAWTTTSGPTAGGPTQSGDGHPSTFDCGQGNVYIEGTVKGQVTIAAQNNVIVTNDLTLTTTSPPLDGSGNVKDAAGSDVIGMVSGNSVVVYHPVSRQSTSGTGVSGTSCSGTVGNNPTDSPSNGTVRTCVWTTTETFNNNYDDIVFPGQTSSSTPRVIYSSIQTLQHSFWVDNYNVGDQQGKLSVRGSIAQKWRGIVGTTGGSGTGYIKDYGYDTRLKYLTPPYFPHWTDAKWGAQTTGELKPQY